MTDQDKMEMVTKMTATAFAEPQVDLVFVHWLAEHYSAANLGTAFTMHDMQKAFHAGVEAVKR